MERTEESFDSVKDWFESAITPPQAKLTRLQLILGRVGYAAGIISAVWTAPLAFTFGQQLVAEKIFHIENDDAQNFFGYFFATFSLPASAILFSRITNFVLIALSAPSKPTFPKVMNSVNPASLIAYRIVAGVCSVINATPPTYLTYVFLSKYLKNWSLIFVLITGLSSAIRNYWSLSNLLYNLYFTVTCHAYRIKGNWFALTDYQELQIKLNDSKVAVYNMPESLLAEEYARFFSDGAVLTQQKINQLVTIGNRHPNYNRRPVFQVLLSLLGSIIGGVATYCFYGISKAGAQKFIRIFNDDLSESGVGFSVFCAILSVLFRGALYLFSVGNTFGYRLYPALTKIKSEKIHNSRDVESVITESHPLINNEVVNDTQSFHYKAIFILSMWISFCGAGPLTMMTYDEVDSGAVYALFILCCAFICSFATKLWVIDGLIEDTVVKTKDMRKPLIKKIDGFSQSLCFFKEDAVNAIAQRTVLSM